MRYQVWLIVSGSGDRWSLGAVATLDDVRQVVDTLDARFAAWESAGFPELPANDVLTVYEGSDIEVTDTVAGTTEEWE